jgi:conjugative transposon TraK protein
MFKQLKNIDQAFRHIRMFTIVMVVVCSMISIWSVYVSAKTVQASQNKIYILANGKAMEALAAERKDNVPVEARDHVKMFHYYFFTLDPDDKVIQSNIGKALYLADISAKKLYQDLKENNYYSNIISGNISQEISIDSIEINTNQYPIYFKCQATQKIIRPSTIVTRSLRTEGWLRNVSRSDNNPHGFLIENWRTLENKDIKTENR